MNIRKQLTKFASVAFILAGATAANAEARPFMARGDTVQAPPGFTFMCERDQTACETAVAMVAPTSPLAMSALSTSSLGRTWPMAMAAAERQASDTAQDAAELGLIMIETLQAYRPEAVEDFLPAGVLRPVAPTPTVAPVVLAAGPAQLGKGQLKLITSINRDVNREVQKANDFDLYGMPEYWTLPQVVDGKMYGDCEDYALEKRRRLIEAGVSAEALSMAVVVTRRGERHAVLVVAFETGDVVLDNLTPWPTPWADLGYTWIQRQVAGSNAWTTVS
ncbi:transglutaminase-like cysteine peptidase [Caulobacter sp. ErkDOM-E]|uniref:transglutaminase-like cysteine peptidase n=1 Tax=Caulobacter sp. ErkDOM-E TaxID=3402778 RepID=UPI003AF9E2BC